MRVIDLLAVGSVVLTGACTPDSTSLGDAPRRPELQTPDAPEDDPIEPQHTNPTRPGRTVYVTGTLQGLPPPTGGLIHLAFSWSIGGGETLATAGDDTLSTDECPQRSGFESTTRGNLNLQSATSTSGSFPLAFQLPIDTMPPQDAIRGFEVANPGFGSYAMGYVMAFADDGDEIFEPPQPGDLQDLSITNSRHTGPSGEFYVLYVEGPAPAPGEHYLGGAPTGLSIYRPTVSHSFQPIETPVELIAVGEQPGSIYACAAIETRSEYGPAPADPDHAQCAGGNGRQAIWWNDPPSPGPACTYYEFIGGRTCLDENETPPSWWPCS